MSEERLALGRWGEEEAVRYLKKTSVDLLLLDMIMDPGMNGRETYEKALEINPQQKALIASGFGEATATQMAGWNPFDPMQSAKFFDPFTMFGFENGFDVVIGNPPWVSLIGKHGIEENRRNIQTYNRIYNGNTTMPMLFHCLVDL